MDYDNSENTAAPHPQGDGRRLPRATSSKIASRKDPALPCYQVGARAYTAGSIPLRSGGTGTHSTPSKSNTCIAPFQIALK